jgi:hypothetical protein
VAEQLEGVFDADAVAATAAALADLFDEALDAIDEWRLLSKKAEEWLERELSGTVHTKDAVLRLARRALS